MLDAPFHPSSTVAPFEIPTQVLTAFQTANKYWELIVHFTGPFTLCCCQGLPGPSGPGPPGETASARMPCPARARRGDGSLRRYSRSRTGLWARAVLAPVFGAAVGHSFP